MESTGYLKWRMLTAISMIQVHAAWSSISHAQTLLGSTFQAQSNSVKTPSSTLKFVRSQTQLRIKNTSTRAARATGQAIYNEAKKKGLDPLLVMAVIQHESKFNPDALGEHGEIGLLQIKPSTAQWIAKANHIPYLNPEQLHDPVFNVRIGTSYLSMLQRKFKSNQNWFLTAYNIGPRAFQIHLNAQQIGGIMKHSHYSEQVLAHYEDLKSGMAMQEMMQVNNLPSIETTIADLQ